MEEIAPAEARQRVAQWIEEGQHLLGLLPELLDKLEERRAQADAAERECEGLRQEISRLQNEKAEIDEAFKKLKEIVQPMTEILQKLGLLPKKSPFER